MVGTNKNSETAFVTFGPTAHESVCWWLQWLHSGLCWITSELKPLLSLGWNLIMNTYQQE